MVVTLDDEPKHDDSCAEWCNHCAVCGVGIHYGSRCVKHYLNQPQDELPAALLAEARAAAEKQIPNADVRMYKVKHFVEGYIAGASATREHA